MEKEQKNYSQASKIESMLISKAKQLHLQICPYYKHGKVCLRYGVKKITSEHI